MADLSMRSSLESAALTTTVAGAVGGVAAAEALRLHRGQAQSGRMKRPTGIGCGGVVLAIQS